MYEIDVDVHRSWLDHEEQLVRRVADVVAGSERARPQRQEQGYAWSLEAGNDWKAEVRDGRLVVAYRYGGGHAEMMAGLATFLAWSLR